LWMPRIRKRPQVEKQLLKIGARQIDRRLKAAAEAKANRWDVQSLSFTEVDLVSHSGEFVGASLARRLRF
jgi:hypothetical protein